MSLFDSDIINELKSLPKGEHHEDSQDAAALAPPPTAGILGAVAACLHHELKEKPHAEIQREPDIFKPTKSMLDILSERIDSDLNKRLTEFGETNGFPVVFVFYQTLKNENGVSKATCDIKMFKSDEKQDARLFALKHAGEFGIFDPRSKDEQIKNWHQTWFGKQVQHSCMGALKQRIKMLVKADRAFVLSKWLPTTKMCPVCGAVNTIGLDERTYHCDCGYTKPRDWHSACNVLLFGTTKRAECVEHASAEVAPAMPPSSAGLAQVAPLKRKPEAHRL